MGKGYPDTVRKPEPEGSSAARTVITVLIMFVGFGIGVLQKYLDSRAVNELPVILQKIDLVNYFGRLAVWILIGTVISVYAKTPLQAAVRTGLFFLSMVAGYYIYCHFVLGFLPVRYMLIWVVLSFVSFFMGYVCWYAKGSGIPAVVLSALILGALLAQAVSLTQGLYIYHGMEVLTWLAGLFLLYRKPKEFVPELVLMTVFTVIFQLFLPYWG